MKWSLVCFDKREDRWVIETIVAEKCFIASSGVISFLDTEKIEVVPPIPEVTEPPIPTLVPTRVGGKRKARVMKVKAKQIPVRAFAGGCWADLQIMGARD